MTSNTRTFLVPVAKSVTLRDTVSYAIETAGDAAETGEATVHFVVVASGRAIDPDGPDELAADRELLERVEAWAQEDRSEADGIAVETDIVGLDRYLFSPGEYAETLIEYATANGVDRIVLDPEYDPGGSAPMLRPLQVDLARSDIEIEEAPVERQTRRTVLARAETLRKAAVVFGASLLFYLVLGSLSLFDVLTGAVTAGIVAVLLAPVAFSEQPSFGRLGRQVVRMGLYAPFLLWEITKANVEVAYVVLHPSLPIDPKMVRLRAAVWGDTPVTTLANSITLTPGTLTVDVAKRSFTIHSLTQSARDDLFDGVLERAVRFVFYGRAAARIASPAERGDGEEIDD
ncbi:monovalent cation/H+ antiporter subunit E [Halomicrobium sp. IBSBa]|uniref:monovalent cation/H+ antiporter subunit E n=1 Tax=Halomicrobium sp. IBSBa TaxID=2778916 RepID=UPI001ABF222F|nr:monovalent cation/H+ antiporter subunit E [Halomicrobium sp. IBSBa]MBO4246662.1 monovalent cation/H+ antiporter subunit E [Halomicrobium sp. IBSBa]